MRTATTVWLALAVTACGLAYDPGAYAASPKRALSVLLGCVCVVSALVRTHRKAAPGSLQGRKPRQRRIPHALLAALAFVGLSTVSVAWGRAPGALDAATWIAGAGVAAFSLRMRRLSAVACARLSAMWLGGATSGIALVLALGGARGFALHAGQGNPNWLGLLLAVTLPLSADTCILHIKRRAIFSRKGVVTLLFLCPQIPALYLSHSRVAWVACAVAIGFVLAGTAHGWRRRAAQVSAVAILTLGIFTGTAAGAEEHDAFTSDVPAAQSLHGRVYIWQISAAAARDAAPFGVGLGGFAHAFHDAQGRALAKLTPSAAARAYENATTAHQEYVQTAAESGPLCALALVLALFLGIAATARARFLGGAGTLIACALASLGDSPLRQPAVVMIIALTLGTLRGAGARRRAASGSSRLLLVVLLTVSAWSFTRSVRAWLGTRDYLASFAAAPDARLHLLARSARLDPGAGEPRFERGLLYLSMGEPRAALSELSLASERMTDPGIFCARAEAHLALNEAQTAESDYRDALTWNPGSLRARVGSASALHRQGKNDEAEANAKIARKLSPGNSEVRDLLDAIHESQADQ